MAGVSPVEIPTKEAAAIEAAIAAVPGDEEGVVDHSAREKVHIKSGRKTLRGRKTRLPARLLFTPGTPKRAGRSQKSKKVRIDPNVQVSGDLESPLLGDNPALTNLLERATNKLAGEGITAQDLQEIIKISSSVAEASSSDSFLSTPIGPDTRPAGAGVRIAGATNKRLSLIHI